jgi:sarcosine oxidase
MTASTSFDVIVIGLGVMGASAARELARRGKRVLALDRFDAPNAMGSSHGRTRIFRVAYFEHPDYVPLLRRARDAWLALNHEAHDQVFHPSGAIWLGRADGPLVGGSRRAAIEHGQDHEMLSRDDVLERWPQFNVEDRFVGFFEEDAGTLFPERCIRAMIALAMKDGASIHATEGAKRWTSDGAGVTVETSRATYRAESLVIAAGAWTASLAPDLGVRLVVSRQPVAWFQEVDARRFDADHFPVWACERDDGAFHYGFPHFRHDPGLKIALHKVGETVDPDTVERRTTPAEIAELDRAMARIIPDAHGRLTSSSVCLYTNSPDGHFVIDRHPSHANVAIACGFSGHGFKFGPVIGEALADLATSGRTDLPIGFLSPRRLLETVPGAAPG